MDDLLRAAVFIGKVCFLLNTKQVYKTACVDKYNSFGCYLRCRKCLCWDTGGNQKLQGSCRETTESPLGFAETVKSTD